MRPVAAAALAALALVACASVPAGMPRRVELYRAEVENWRLRMFNTGVRFGAHEWSELPAAQALDGGVRFEGTVSWTYVVAGLVEESTAAYRLEIRAEPCRDRRGRMHPTSVRLTYEAGNEHRGCGGPLPAAWPVPMSG